MLTLSLFCIDLCLVDSLMEALEPARPRKPGLLKEESPKEVREAPEVTEALLWYDSGCSSSSPCLKIQKRYVFIFSLDWVVWILVIFAWRKAPFKKIYIANGASEILACILECGDLDGHVFIVLIARSQRDNVIFNMGHFKLKVIRRRRAGLEIRNRNTTDPPPMHGDSQNFCSSPNSSPSWRVCGSTLPTVSGRKRHSSPPTMPNSPRISKGRDWWSVIWKMGIK